MPTFKKVSSLILVDSFFPWHVFSNICWFGSTILDHKHLPLWRFSTRIPEKPVPLGWKNGIPGLAAMVVVAGKSCFVGRTLHHPSWIAWLFFDISFNERVYRNKGSSSRCCIYIYIVVTESILKVIGTREMSGGYFCFKQLLISMCLNLC